MSVFLEGVDSDGVFANLLQQKMLIVTSVTAAKKLGPHALIREAEL